MNTAVVDVLKSHNQSKHPEYEPIRKCSYTFHIITIPPTPTPTFLLSCSLSYKKNNSKNSSSGRSLFKPGRCAVKGCGYVE